MIQLSGLSKTYPDGTRALENVDLEIGDGLFGLLGPNGAGKTTLLSILVLAQEPSSGRRSYFGLTDRSRNRRVIRRGIGYLPQELTPVGLLTGYEYLCLCGALRQVPLPRRRLQGRARRLLDVVGLAAAANRRCETYSGGMVRRLGLAQALIHAPRLLVVDEPTAGLDPEERVHLRNVLTEIADEIPVLLSTHIVEDIEATCPRIGVLCRGRLLYDGEPSRLLRQARGTLWQLATEAPVPPGANYLHQRTVDGGPTVQVLHCRRRVTGARALEPNLEDAYGAFLADQAHAAAAGGRG